MMAMTARDVKLWIAGVPDDHLIAVDDGGLCLVEVEDQSHYCEIGGIPEEEEQ